MLHVLYLLFNEGYASSSGPDLAAATCPARRSGWPATLHASLPGDPEVTGLLALMLLTDARWPARTGPGDELIRWLTAARPVGTGRSITEGTSLITGALRQGEPGDTSCRPQIADLPCTTRRR